MSPICHQPGSKYTTKDPVAKAHPAYTRRPPPCVAAAVLTGRLLVR